MVVVEKTDIDGEVDDQFVVIIFFNMMMNDEYRAKERTVEGDHVVW